MKKIQLLLGALLAFVLFVPQSIHADDRATIVKAGYLNSAFYNDGKQGSGQDGFFVGLHHETQIAPLFSIVSGLEYLQLGGDGVFGIDYTTHTLSVPVSAKLKVGPVYGLAGVAANFNLSSDGSSESAGSMNVFDYPLHAAVGFNFLKVGVEARYNWGMRDAFDTSALGGLRTNYLQLGAYVSF